MRLILFIILILVIITITNTNSYGEQVPNWVKNTAGWWATDSISEIEFINAIEFLINVDIIHVNLIETELSSQEIPEWVKNTAGWWATDSISEIEFINAIEFLIDNGIISIEKKCSDSIDKDGNNIPDVLEDQMEKFVGIQRIQDLNFSNCNFPKDLSNYDFKNVDFSNSNISNTILRNTNFSNSVLHNTDFSNSKLHGIVFFESDLDNVNFENSEFSTMPSNFDRVIVYFNETKSNVTCTFENCSLHMLHVPGIETSNENRLAFGKDNIPLNMIREKTIQDSSDKRIMYILSPTFILNEINDVNFQTANLEYSVFGNNYFENVDFSKANISSAVFYNSNFIKTQFSDRFIMNEFVKSVESERKLFGENENIEIFISNLIFHTDNFKDVQLKHTIGYPMINWSLGMLIDNDENILIVANTDDHTIDIFSLDNFELLQSFTSPIQFECLTTHTWTKTTGCSNEHRNLPTSIAKLNEKIFVAYGWQNEIQVFNSQGEYLYKFGQMGNKSEEFIDPFNINIWEEKLYVLDSGNNRIKIFDENSNYEDEFLTSVLPDNNSPIDFSIYDGEIFVAYDLNSHISRFNLEGQLIEIIDLSPHIEADSISSIHVKDELMAISDSSQHQIIIFDLSGKPQISFGEKGNGYGQFNSPQDVIFEDSLLFVSDAYNYRIQIFDIIR